MPIVVETNCLSSVFDKACIDHAEFEPVFNWIINGKGKLIYGGSKYNNELSKCRRVIKFINLLKRYKNKVVVLRKDEVDNLQKKIESLVKDPDFDDPHLIAIISVSRCQLLCSKDERSERFILDKKLYPKRCKPPKYYKSKKNTNLLSDSYIPSRFKPIQPLNKEEKNFLCSHLNIG